MDSRCLLTNVPNGTIHSFSISIVTIHQTILISSIVARTHTSINTKRVKINKKKVESYRVQRSDNVWAIEKV
ncbi:hypothetical protein BLOT_012685 [Blomia tropicalis]|nr:hypothetical protein BLOT_012685 [Blomia tropicalis]